MRLALVALSMAMAGLLAAAFAAHTPKPTLAAIGTLMAGAAKKDGTCSELGRPGGGRGVENVRISRKFGFSLANFELGLLRDQTELGVEI